MPARLLDSPFEALEPLGPDEPGLTLDAAADTGSNLDLAQAALGRFDAERNRTEADSGDKR